MFSKIFWFTWAVGCQKYVCYALLFSFQIKYFTNAGLMKIQSNSIFKWNKEFLSREAFWTEVQHSWTLCKNRLFYTKRQAVKNSVTSVLWSILELFFWTAMQKSKFWTKVEILNKHPIAKLDLEKISESLAVVNRLQ